MKKYLPLVLLSLALEAFGFVCLQYEIEPFRRFFYATSWWSYIILADTTYAFRQGRFLVLTRRLPLLVLISSGYWCIFELLNVRLQNWHYISLPSEFALRYAGYLLSFGTVIPAILVTKELIAALLPRSRNRARKTPDLRKWYPLTAILCGFACLLLVFIFPLFMFPLAWVFLTLVFDGYNYRRGYPSFMKDVASGSWTGLLTSAISGLICGLMWEAWNYNAVSKWIYTVPFLEGMKLFEMPLPGYAGFPAFGVETMAFVGFLKGIESSKAGLYVLSVLSLALSLVAFSLIDRYTVLSFDVLYR